MPVYEPPKLKLWLWLWVTCPTCCTCEQPPCCPNVPPHPRSLVYVQGHPDHAERVDRPQSLDGAPAARDEAPGQAVQGAARPVRV